MCIAGLDAQLLLVVVLLEVALEATRQLQLIDAIVCGIRDNCCARQLLQRERLAAMQRHGQTRLKEHHARRILVMLQQSGNRQSSKHARIMTIKAVGVKKVKS